MNIIEKNKRLTDSKLWELQHIAYSQFGPEAWTNKGVPFYLTSNPLIAKQFSHMILGYIRDCFENLDPTEPIYLFDLGAGSGRLGYLLIKHLVPILNAVFSERIRLRYIMTDVVEKNLSFLKNHSYLQESIEKGVLDFAQYHHTDTSPMKLLVSGDTLTKESMVNPVVLICTYFFDTIPQDLFRAKEGKLEEGRITISLPKENNAEDLDPSMIMKLEAHYNYVPIEDPAAYYLNRPELYALLKEYTETFDDTPFLFPIGTFDVLRYFSNLSKNRMLLLAGDQGVCTEKQVKEWGEPKIFRHASFSMAVSYHLLAKYFQQQGGMGLLTSFPNPKFVVMGGVLGSESEGCPETCLAFKEHIDLFEPVEYWELTNIEPEHLEKLPLKHLILYVKLGCWDLANFFLFFPAIRKKMRSASENLKEELYRVVYKVWENFYPVGEQEGGFVVNLGVLMFEMEKYEEALFFFNQAKEIGGEETNLLMNIAKCYRALGDHPQARHAFQRAISLKANDQLGS